MHNENVDNETFMQILNATQRFIEKSLLPLERQVEEEDAVPDHIAAAMRELGFFGLTIPPEYGGLGISMSQEAQFQMLMGTTSPAFRYIYGTNIGLGTRGLVIAGTPEQKAKFLPKFASGEWVAAFAMTEPEAGSDAANLKATARRHGDRYILNGTKRFITNAPRADVITVLARTDAAGSGHQGISAFLVPRGSPGLSIGKPEKKMGQHGSQISDVILENAVVPAANLIGGEEGLGFKMAMKVLDCGRINVASTGVGMARRLIDESRNYALERKQFGRPIADFQLVQALIADSQTEYYAARCMTLDAAAKLDRDGAALQEAACAKYFSSEMLGRVADRAVQIFGGAGYIAEYPVERLYRDARVLRLYEGTSQIMQLVIAKNALRA
jgi:acyl-CoA dehydrogenase